MNSKLSFKYKNEISYHGVEFKVLKSALQKYVRRDDFYKGIWTLLELQTFDEKCKKSDLTRQKSIRTNTINRMIVMMSEEICINNIWLPEYMRELHIKIINSEISMEKLHDLELKMYFLLLNSKKCRIISDLRTVFNLPEYYLSNFAEISKLHQNFLKKFPEIHNLVYDVKFSGLSKSELLILFEKTLSEKNISCFAVLSHLFAFLDEKSRIEKGKEICKILLKNSGTYKNPIESLCYFYNKLKHKERFIYLWHAILLIIKKPKLVGFVKSLEDVLNCKEYEEFKEITGKIKEKFYENEKIEFDDFVYDIHTGNIKKSEGLIKFAQDGSFIKNECKDYLNEEYRKIYIEFKEVLENHMKIKKNPIPEINLLKSPIKPIEFKNDDLELLNLLENSLPDPIPAQQPSNFEISEKPQNSGTEFSLKNIKKPLEKISADFDLKIQNFPRAQLKTASFKKSVFVDKNLVYKGKFSKNDTNFILTLTQEKAMEILEISELKLPKITFDKVLKIVQVDEKDEFYLVFQNHGNLENAKIEIMSSKIEQNVKIIQRESLVDRISELDIKGKLSENEKIIVLQHLYVQFIIGCGDYGPHNIIKSKNNEILGIDMECRRLKQDLPTKIENLMKKPSKERIEIYSPLIPKIKTLSEISDKTRAELCELDPEIIKSVENNIKIWSKLK